MAQSEDCSEDFFSSLLSDSDKTRLSDKLAQSLEAMGNEPWYQSYKTLYEYYADDDLSFANLLASFNILTQYADFELLKAQDPEEAARLGIQ